MNRNVNLTDGHGTTSGRMSEFDKLPKAARLALANADHNWSGEQLLRVSRSKRHPGHHKVRTAALMVSFIREQDVKRHNVDAADGIVMGGQR